MLRDHRIALVLQDRSFMPGQQTEIDPITRTGRTSDGSVIAKVSKNRPTTWDKPLLIAPLNLQVGSISAIRSESAA